MITYPPRTNDLEQTCCSKEGSFFQNQFSTALQFYPKTLEFKLNQEFQNRGFNKEEADVYLFHIFGFLNFLDKPPETMCEEDIEPYLKDLPEESKGVAENSIHLLFSVCFKSRRII